MLHVELRNWADIMVIAPLSTNTLGKIALGLCDNLLTSIVRAWDYRKPLFVAPSMSTCIWEDFFTERHLNAIDELGIILIRPVSITTASGEREHAMAEPSTICSDGVASLALVHLYLDVNVDAMLFLINTHCTVTSLGTNGKPVSAIFLN
uniref:phosphopantothenoylcysteine decarboxylase n=1 Tax=Glycine max TaxID=3847 RepID=K7LGA7_SOYBN